MIIHSNLSKTKNEVLPACLEGNYGDILGEFRIKPYGVFGAERINRKFHSCARTGELLSKL